MDCYPKNFDPATFLGIDGATPEPGDDDTWSVWCLGGDPRFPKDFALFCWWHFADAIHTFVCWADIADWPPEYKGGGRRAESKFRKELIRNFRAVCKTGDEAWQTQPFLLETQMPTSDDGQLSKKVAVQMMCAYSIKCLDDGISGLFEKNLTKVSMAFAYAIRALILAHEYRSDPGDALILAGKHALSCMARSGAIAKLKRDPRQNEKAFVYECWHDWQKKPDSYKSKAAFSRDMLTKAEHLKSQKKIEDWCREWEAKSGTQRA